MATSRSGSTSLGGGFEGCAHRRLDFEGRQAGRKLGFHQCMGAQIKFGAPCTSNKLPQACHRAPPGAAAAVRSGVQAWSMAAG